MPFQIVPMQPHHLAGVQAVQQRAYASELWESTDALAQKQQLSAATCFIAQTSAGEVIAYIFTHPWLRHAIPKLNTVLSAIPVESELLYIHDLAVHPAWHGQRLAQLLMVEVQRVAQDSMLTEMALVAVQGAQTFWQRLAFVEDTQAKTQLFESLQVYGEGALYMMRSTHAT
jgi:predicted N-acetyltransferase YhbS